MATRANRRRWRGDEPAAARVDWRDAALDAGRAALLAGAPLTLALGPREQSFRLALTFLLVLLPRALAVPRPFDLAFLVAMSFQAWGNVFGAFDGIYGYDKVVHFILPAASSALLFLLAVRLRAMPDLATVRGLHADAGIVLSTLAFGLTLGGGLYELYEWFANRFLGAHLYVSYGDSIGDLLFDTLGSLLGGALIVVWNHRGWSSRRPGAPSPAVRPRSDRQDDPLARMSDRLVARVRRTGDDPHGERPLPRGPRWLVGDWSALVRDPVDLLRASLAAGVLVAAAERDTEHAVRFAITLAAAVAVRRLAVPRLFDLVFVAAMAVQAWGSELSASASLAGYGAAVHVIVSVSAACVLYLALVRLRVVPDLSERHDLHQRAAIALLATSLGFSAGIGYELYVFAADHVLGADFRVGYDDLIGRLALDVLGAAVGAGLMVVWAGHGWGTRRRPATAHARSAAGRG